MRSGFRVRFDGNDHRNQQPAASTSVTRNSTWRLRVVLDHSDTVVNSVLYHRQDTTQLALAMLSAASALFTTGVVIYKFGVDRVANQVQQCRRSRGLKQLEDSEGCSGVEMMRIDETCNSAGDSGQQAPSHTPPATALDQPEERRGDAGQEEDLRALLRQQAREIQQLKQALAELQTANRP